MDYLEKLKDPRWQRKRLELLNTHHFSCMRCKTTEKQLHVHHRKYERGREPWDYNIENFFILCTDCHNELHKALEWFGIIYVCSSNKQLNEIHSACIKILGY